MRSEAGVAVHASRQCDIEDHFEQNYNHAGTGTNEEQRGGAGIAEGDESGFQSRKDKTACSCRLSPRSPRPRDVISTKKSVQNYKTGFLRRSTAVSSQGARAGKRGRVRLAGTASPHLCPADARHDLKTGRSNAEARGSRRETRVGFQSRKDNAPAAFSALSASPRCHLD